MDTLTSPSEKPIKVALIGYGHLGRWHADKAYELESSQLVAIVERNKEQQRKAREKFPDCLIVENIDEVMELIDAALVVTPTCTHFELCEKLITNEKHVFCEKPMTESLEQALILSQLAKDKNLVIQIGHSERFHQIWEKKSTFSYFLEGAASVKIERCAPFKGRATDVSVVSDLMIHDLDLIYFLFKERPNSLQSTGFKIRTDKWDYVSTTLFYDCQKEVNIINSRNDIIEKRSLSITNHRGTICFNLLDGEYSYGLNDELDSDKFIVKESYPKRDHLLLEQTYFFDSIANNKKSIVPIEDGVMAVRLIEKVLESLEHPGKIVIPTES